jgi:hypothetical protein
VGDQGLSATNNEFAGTGPFLTALNAPKMPQVTK